MTIVNKKNLILYFLAFNAGIFLSFHKYKNILSLDTLSALWSWSIWLYIFYQLSVLVGYARNQISRSSFLIMGLDYILLLLYFIEYIFFYVYGYYDSGYFIVVTLLLIMLFEVITCQILSRSNKLASSSIEDKLNKAEIREYIYMKMTRGNIYITKERQKRIFITILNNATILFMCFTPIIGEMLSEIYNIGQISLYFLGFTSLCFFILNRIKYKECNISFIRFMFDIITCILGIFYYSLLYRYYDIGMFCKIFISIYLLIPIIISSEKILKIYQIGVI